jgi:hypothetical protein
MQGTILKISGQNISIRIRIRKKLDRTHNTDYRYGGYWKGQKFFLLST